MPHRLTPSADTGGAAETTPEERAGWLNDDIIALGAEIDRLRARLAESETERDQMLRDLARMFPGSKWADRAALTPPEPT